MNSESIDEAMAKKIIEYIFGRRDEKLETFLKAPPKKNKRGEVTKGAINERAEKILGAILKEPGREQQKKQFEEIIKSKKGNDQSSLSFQLDKFEKYKNLIAGDDLFANEKLNELSGLDDELNNFIRTNNETHSPVNWLNEWTPKAKDISFATHVAKLTHPSSKGSSIFETSQKQLKGIVSTNCLIDKEIDVAVSNAASNPIGSVLKLSENGISLLELLKNNNYSPLEKISNNPENIKKWVDNLKQAYEEKQIKSYFLNKQVYFLVNDKHYHLLLPLVSSSMAQHLYSAIEVDPKEQNMAWEAYKKGEYSSTIIQRFPNKAVLSITDNLKAHSNVSQLNNSRKGKLTLLNAEPPQWKSTFSNIKTRQNIFDYQLESTIKEEITDLKNYLRLLKNKKLSISHPVRNAAIKTKALAVISSFFDYIEMLIMAESQPNWTLTSNLPLEQQLLFEPSREDDAVKDIKLNKQWQKELSKDFGRWLNKQLNSGKKNRLNLTPIHEAIWTDWFLYKLKEYSDIKEVSE